MAIDIETMQLIERVVARAVSNATSLKGASDEIAKGVTQYVGARYVPLFAEPLEWDKTKAYEPLTIVLYQGNSYTSRQYVPVGVEIDNDSFWANTGNYNAQVEQYRQEVKTFDGRITANANAIETEATNRAEAVSAEMKRAQSAEQTLQSNIDAEKSRAEGAEQTLQSNIDAEKSRAEGAEQTLQEKDNKLESSKKDKSVMVVFGDSFSVEAAGTGGSTGPLWWQLVSKELSMEPDSFAESGAGFIKYYSVTLDSEFERAKAKYNTEELIASVKRVYILAGLNDLILGGVGDTFFDTVNQFIANVKAYFTNAYVTYANNFTPDPIARQGISLDAFNLYCIFKPNMPYMYDYISGATNLFRNDNGENFLHPNADGEKFIADMMLGRAEPVLQYQQSDTYFNKLTNCDKVSCSIAKLGNQINGNINVKITELSSPSSFYFPTFYIVNGVYDMYLPVYQSATSQVTVANIKMQSDGLKLTIPAITDATPFNNTVYIPIYFKLPDNRRV